MLEMPDQAWHDNVCGKISTQNHPKKIVINHEESSFG